MLRSIMILACTLAFVNSDFEISAAQPHVAKKHTPRQAPRFQATHLPGGTIQVKALDYMRVRIHTKANTYHPYVENAYSAGQYFNVQRGQWAEIMAYNGKWSLVQF